MTSIFLDQYSISGWATFEGHGKHYNAFSKEKSWNCYAIAHLILSALEAIPGISQLVYTIEALANYFFASVEKFTKPTEGNPTTIFGTKNQYTNCQNEDEKQSCTVQALTFLKHFLDDGQITKSRINKCINEGHKIFKTLNAKNSMETRRANAKNYLIQQGANQEAVEQFFEQNPKEINLNGIAILAGMLQGDINTHNTQLSTILSGASLDAQAAARAFEQGLSAEDGCRLQNLNDLFAFPENNQGIVMTGGGITIAIAKRNDQFVVYDSHGNASNNDGNTGAFAKVFATEEEGKAFLMTLFVHDVNQIDTTTVGKLREQGCCRNNHRPLGP